LEVREAIRRARLEKGLSQKELADAIHVAQTNVSQWERGSTRPKARNLKRLAEVLDKPVDYFFGDHPLTGSDSESPHEIPTPSDNVLVPLLGTLPLGSPLEAIETTDVFIRTTPAEASQCDFAFRVVGNSMYPFFWDGDMVGVKLAEQATDRQIVVARLGSGDATLKMYRQDPTSGQAWLEPLNKSHAPLRGEDFEIRGIVVWIRKPLPGGHIPSPV